MFADIRLKEVREFKNIGNLLKTKWLLSLNGEVIADQNTGSYLSRSTMSWSLLFYSSIYFVGWKSYFYIV